MRCRSETRTINVNTPKTEIYKYTNIIVLLVGVGPGNCLLSHPSIHANFFNGKVYLPYYSEKWRKHAKREATM